MSGPQKRLQIAVDLDGVLAESMIVWCEKVNTEFGKSIQMNDLDSWASWKKVSITKDDFYRILDESWEDWEQIPPTEPGISRKVAQIKKFGDLDIVTGRSKNTEGAARSWIQHQKVPFRNFVRVQGWRNKLALGYDVYIDDAPDLMPLISRSPLVWAVLYGRPWNRDVPRMPKVSRVKSWTQIPKSLDKIRKTGDKS